MKRIFSILVISAFFIAIIMPLAGAILSEDKTLSLIEKRKLQQLPDMPGDMSDFRAFISDFEDYYNDHFGFRSFFLSYYKKIKNFIGDEDIAQASKNVGTPNIIVGKEGYHFLNRKWDGDPVSDYRNIDLYSEVQLWRSTLLLAARSDWLKERNIEYILFFAPNKHTIYEEYLPDYIQKEGEISSLDQLSDSLERLTDVHHVDLRQTLKSNKSNASRYWSENKENAALYYKMDSHWNGAGADIVQYAVAEKMSAIFPGHITPYRRNPEDFVMQWFTGDITWIRGSREKEAYGPRLFTRLCGDGTLEDPPERSYQTSCPTAELNSVIYHDSFFTLLKGYFSDYYKTTYFRWKKFDLQELEALRKRDRIDIVIEEHAERFLPYTPNYMKDEYPSFWKWNWPKWKKVVFTLNLVKTGAGQYQSSNLIPKYMGKTKGVELLAQTADPMIYLPEVDLKKDRLYLMEIQITSDQKTHLQLFYSINGRHNPFPSEKNSIRVTIEKGENRVYLPLFSLNHGGEFRFDPGGAQGTYYLKKLQIKELTVVDLKHSR